MHEELRTRVEKLFIEAPQTKKARELKEEFFVNLCDKYDDLITGGLSPEAAAEKVMSSIGDVSELFSSLEEEIMIDSDQYNAQRKKNAAVVTGSIMMYIVSVIIVIIMSEFNVNDTLVTCVFLVLIAIPTAALVYNYMSQPRYRRTEDTLVEEFKEFTDAASRNKAAWKALTGSFWCLTTALYFFISFFFGAWAWSWIIFILAAGIQGIIKATLEMRR